MSAKFADELTQVCDWAAFNGIESVYRDSLAVLRDIPSFEERELELRRDLCCSILAHVKTSVNMNKKEFDIILKKLNELENDIDESIIEHVNKDNWFLRKRNTILQSAVAILLDHIEYDGEEEDISNLTPKQIKIKATCFNPANERKYKAKITSLFESVKDHYSQTDTTALRKEYKVDLESFTTKFFRALTGKQKGKAIPYAERVVELLQQRGHEAYREDINTLIKTVQKLCLPLPTLFPSNSRPGTPRSTIRDTSQNGRLSVNKSANKQGSPGGYVERRDAGLLPGQNEHGDLHSEHATSELRSRRSSSPSREREGSQSRRGSMAGSTVGTPKRIRHRSEKYTGRLSTKLSAEKVAQISATKPSRINEANRHVTYSSPTRPSTSASASTAPRTGSKRDHRADYRESFDREDRDNEDENDFINRLSGSKSRVAPAPLSASRRGSADKAVHGRDVSDDEGDIAIDNDSYDDAPIRHVSSSSANKRKRASSLSEDEDDDNEYRSRVVDRLGRAVSQKQTLQHFPATLNSTTSRREQPNQKSGIRVNWTPDEELTLLIAVREYGKGNWTAILDDPKYKFHDRRTNVHLKDKYRNIEAAKRKAAREASEARDAQQQQEEEEEEE